MTAEYEQLLTRGLKPDQEAEKSTFDPVAFYEGQLLQQVRLEVGGRVLVVLPADGGRRNEFTILEIGPNVILTQGGNRFPVDIDRFVNSQTIEVPEQGVAHIIQIRPGLNGRYPHGENILAKWIG